MQVGIVLVLKVFLISINLKIIKDNLPKSCKCSIGGRTMAKPEKLKLEINELRHRLSDYLENDVGHDKIFQLNIEIDQLIVKYYRLKMENKT